MEEQLEKNLVRENLHLATTSQRLKAFVVDELLVSLVMFAAFFGEFSNSTSVTETIEAINSLALAIIALKVFYHAIFTAVYGATLGKIWQKIFVITIDGFEKPSFFVSFIRANVRILSEWLMYFGFLWAYFDKNRQTWHDKMARTIVVSL